MVALRSRAPDNLNIPGEHEQQETMGKEDGVARMISEYELSREERIKENRERMQKLGIVDLSLKLKALRPTPNRGSYRKTPQVHSPLPPSGPVRRSSRLQNSTPVSYCEVRVPKKDISLNDDDLLREEGSKPEIYTEEHEKLLGSTEMSWTPFVDGYGKDGKRIYDPVKGKTCHQCRQKTLGHRTHCCKCKLVQGQFCGDCLYMRYGENVLEANQNPNWICPVCRGICNCSLCRQAKGWPPTGSLYRKISSLGYKSVAHYLIQTRRSNTDSDKDVGTKVPNSAKRSLPFSDIEVTKGGDDLSKPNREYSNTDPQSVFDKEFGDIKVAPESGVEPAVASQSYDQVEYSLSLEPEENGTGCDSEHDKNSIELKTTPEPMKDSFLTEASNFHKGLVSETLERGNDDDIKKENLIMDKKDVVAPETSPKSPKKRILYEPPPDSMARRLRHRRNKTNNTSKELGPVNTDYTTINAEDASTISDPDSIARRLKMRRRA
ncbi:Cell division cycle-associated 7-like protein [Sesamum alatum]|uniref:Cell division cycle-associated 7-like protein n=1 Tax=Sesamum alatum TaxID=300844 RepID=A0AAE1XRK0_9LAMI|nr:Cell division cycle-associated 7-like protein [Sesamum alatum]